MIVKGLISGYLNSRLLDLETESRRFEEGATLHEVFIKRSIMKILEGIQGDRDYLGYWDRNEFNDWIQAYKTLDRR